MNKEEKIEFIAGAFEEHRTRLLKIAQLKIPEMLRKRVSAEDLFHDTYIATLQRIEHFCNATDVPTFIRIRTMMLQTLHDLERKHLKSQKRDAMREIDFDANNNDDATNQWNFLASSMTSPRTKIAKREQQILIRELLNKLSATDKEIIEMRNFENLSNAEVAKILDIEPKNASIRYVRALKKFKEILTSISEFN